MSSDVTSVFWEVLDPSYYFITLFITRVVISTAVRGLGTHKKGLSATGHIIGAMVGGGVWAPPDGAELQWDDTQGYVNNICIVGVDRFPSTLSYILQAALRMERLGKPFIRREAAQTAHHFREIGC